MTLADRARSGTLPIACAVVALLAILPLLPLSQRSVYVLAIGLIYAIAAVGLDVFGGYAGLLAVCGFAFVGIGAYSAVILSSVAGLSIWFGLPAAVLTSASIGAVIGLPMVRLRELGVALATFFFAFASVALFEGDLLATWTRSSTGLRVPPLSLGTVPLSRGNGLYYLAWTILLLVVLVTGRYVNCRAGRALRLVKRSDTVAQAMGVNTVGARLFAFVYFSAVAGAAGFVYGQAVGYLSPAVFPGLESVFLLAMVVIGGIGSVAGPILGAVGFQLLSQATRGAGGYREMAVALLLLIALVLLPEGFYGAIERGIARGKRWFATRSRHAPDVAVAAQRTGAAAASQDLPSAAPSARAAGAGYALALSGVSVHYGGVRALDDVSLKVPPSSIFAILGPNGAGKTTLLNSISGAQRCEGEIRLDEALVSGLHPRKIRRLRVSRTFQHPSLVGDLSVIENVELGLYGDAPSSPFSDILPSVGTRRRDLAARAAAQAALRLVRMPPERDNALASELSLAEQKLTDIARAIVARPRLLLLDEPTAGLAETEMDLVSDVLRRVRDTSDVTIVVIAHHMGFIRSLAQHAVVLDFGQVIAHGSPDDVLRDPAVMSVFIGGAHV
jgi:branched-chain amino acid transport system permease protein